MSSNFREIKLSEAHRLSQANYLPRILGLGASFVVITLLVLERDLSYWYFPFMVVSFLIYPHLVYLTAKSRPGDKQVEIKAMMFESLMVGIWTGFTQFFIWESFAFLAGVLITNTMIGGFKQMFKALFLFAFGMLIGGVFMGFEYQPEAPFYIEVAAMLSLILFVTNAAASFFTQARKLAGIRGKLEEKNSALNETVQELHATRDELVHKAHKAGMADLATGVLHNIGNILNSVNISTNQIKQTLTHSSLSDFKKANELLDSHKDNLEEFIIEDPRGKKLLKYYQKLEEPLEAEHKKLKTHCKRLNQKIQLMIEVIDTQQDYARVGRLNEQVQLEQIVEDTLTLQAGSIDRHSLDIVKDFGETQPVIVQKSKLIHILINLFKNAKEAMADNLSHDKEIIIRTYQDEEHVYLSISDKGEGITSENRSKIFNHGFTTKTEGHGYGLHSCANYMSEMDGKIRVESEGIGKGATFILVFPRSKEKPKMED
ncbi:ATP-binding protein [Aliifodinibius salicampi]|uniref:histidine kinase n=1 Tax=Fodinibius salicampi TaxID=1920655 RepID=A0ABT3PVU7_9BACT|nr:ATP-binding protein [Fodinibius salicampi]MCW9711958.1 ATP-binding protein [Fodinibius salicampi]